MYFSGMRLPVPPPHFAVLATLPTPDTNSTLHKTSLEILVSHFEMGIAATPTWRLQIPYIDTSPTTCFEMHDYILHTTRLPSLE